jgi:DNA primase
LGYNPVKVTNADHWYRSPLREENEPSFKVNRKLNLWFDHGLGKGGNLIDFGILYNNCTASELLQN